VRLPVACALVPALALAGVCAAGAPAGAAPGDALIGEQWAASSRTVVNLPAAWRLSQGAGVVVAVVDTGANLRHRDLAPNIWTNFGERPGNGRDDDANGYVDDVHGIDLTSGRTSNRPDDAQGHGTHVAGIIAGAANRRGIVGVAYRAKLMIVKVAGGDGRTNTAKVAEGIRYAAANGARVINVSIGGRGLDPALADAVEAAGQANALVVAAAGNNGSNNDAAPIYPASLAAPNLVSVAATAPDDGRRLSPVSNYGRRTVALAAPGEGVLSTSRTGGYEVRTGTSMAAPHVSGVAALMLGARRDISAADLRAQILQTAARAPVAVSAGYLDAEAAVRSVTTATAYHLGQRPVVRILDPAAGPRDLTFRIAVTGATAAIRRHRVRLGRRSVVVAAARGSEPVAVRIRVRGMAGRRMRVDALDRRGRVIARARARIRRVARDKPDTSRGTPIVPLAGEGR
jgi:subtilisin family serine protease